MNVTPLYCRMPIQWWLDPSICWFEWQTLISGLLAVAAAGVTVFYLKRQISQAEEHEQARLKRRFNAARASLPLTLSGLCDYAKRMIDELSQVRGIFHFVGDDHISSQFNLPPPPTELISSLQGVIESTDRENIVDVISEIIGEMQVLAGRVGLLNTESQNRRVLGLAQNVDTYIIQAARIYALATSLFEFARREDDVGPVFVGWEDVKSALRLMNIRGDGFAELFGQIEQKIARRKNAWQFRDD